MTNAKIYIKQLVHCQSPHGAGHNPVCGIFLPETYFDEIINYNYFPPSGLVRL